MRDKKPPESRFRSYLSARGFVQSWKAQNRISSKSKKESIFDLLEIPCGTLKVYAVTKCNQIITKAPTWDAAIAEAEWMEFSN